MLRIILADEERTVGHGLNGSKLLKQWGLCRVEGVRMTKNRVLRPNGGLNCRLIPPSRVRTVEKEVSSVADSAPSQGGIGPGPGSHRGNSMAAREPHHNQYNRSTPPIPAPVDLRVPGPPRPRGHARRPIFNHGG